jgi:hypothetical protein
MAQKARILEDGWLELKEVGARRLSGLGKGLTNRARQNAPVRRGYRSFDSSPGPLGGTLRAAITYAVAIDGKIVDSPGDLNGAQAPGWLPSEFKGGRDRCELIVYTNTAATVNPLSGTAHDYGLHVHEGTTRMAGRPFLLEALQETDLKDFGG